MALRKKGRFRYGDSQSDIRDELLRYSTLNGYPTDYYADAICVCNSSSFVLVLDDDAGAGVRFCLGCKAEHPIADSREFLEEAELQECECPCGSNVFEITVGVSLYQNSEDVKWLYIGCRCVNCELIACYGDWKNEYEGYLRLLNQI